RRAEGLGGPPRYPAAVAACGAGRVGVGVRDRSTIRIRPVEKGTNHPGDDDHALVGIATGLEAGDGDTYVVGMYVAPEARGAGCAHQLLDAIAELATRCQGSAWCWTRP